jgi:signal transduction histidine kinase/CheY-like chemotaxis protein
MTDGTDASGQATPSAVSASTPYLHRFIAAGHLRYWIIGSWGLALLTTVPWRMVLGWFAVTMLSGLARTVVETRWRPASRRLHARAKLAIATVSCIAWAGAPMLSFFAGHAYGTTMAIVLLIAGYMLVFTQMRAAPKEGLVVSAPYSVVAGVILVNMWGDPGFWPVVAMGPVLGLSILIKVVITQIKDQQLAAVNDRQGQLISELESARDQAHAASEAKTRFLAVISHELRTPMNGVLGAAQLLEMSPLKPAQKDYVGIIRRSGEGLLVLLNDILDLTKIEAGRMELSLAETGMHELVERSIGPFRAQAEAKGLDFVVEEEGDLPAVVSVDPLRVAQIVHNLLSNAVKFTQEGAVRVRLVGERVSGDRARLSFCIEDSGAGISDEDLKRLFRPFTQVDASSTRRFGGTGLGLSICRRLAHLMGGDVEVRSVLGDGSVFTLNIEVKVLDWTAGSEAPATAIEATPEQTALKVLVVEDHPVNRMVLEAWLQSMGHACIAAENGAEALEAAQVEAFDLIIMDVNMPVMDGLTATRELRHAPGPNRDAPVAVLSASARPEDHASGFQAGADAYVDKPVDFAALARVLAAAPAGRSAVQALQEQRAAA